jgi:DNA-binding LacI/PurR family transcriptional regulator
VLSELGMPTVVVGTPLGAGGLPAVWQDDRTATAILVGHLAGLGHRRIARVGGFPRYWHSKLRTDAFAQVAGAAGLQARSVAADYTAEHGIEATRELLEGPHPPTAILYDNDVMAVAALSDAQRGGLAVPGDLSILAWGDSALCELVHPAVTALRWDTVEAGTRAARLLNGAADGGEIGNFQEGPPVLMVRESTGPEG